MAGADPSFSEIHLLRTLLTLHEKPTGRKKLVKLLGVGEGSVRTIIRKLTASRYISSSKKGHTLTEKGTEHVEEILAKISRPAETDLGGIVGGHQSLIIVYGAAAKTGSPVVFRDAALKAGADGALILTHNHTYRLPGVDLNNYPETLKKLKKIPAGDGDALVVVFAQTPQKAEDGALAAALEILKKTGDQPTLPETPNPQSHLRFPGR